MLDFDMEALKAEVENAEIVSMDDCFMKTVWLGTVMGLAPSGKYYQPFACSNVTEEEANADEEYWSELEEELEANGMSLMFEDDSAFAMIVVDNPDE